MLDLTATVKHFNGISFLPVILETKILTGSNTDISVVSGGEGPPGQDTGHIPILGQHFGLHWVYVPAVCTTPIGQISVAA